jgi:hypothetical protein
MDEPFEDRIEPAGRSSPADEALLADLAAVQVRQMSHQLAAGGASGVWRAPAPQPAGRTPVGQPPSGAPDDAAAPPAEAASEPPDWDLDVEAAMGELRKLMAEEEAAAERPPRPRPRPRAPAWVSVAAQGGVALLGVGLSCLLAWLLL